jgi:hypothetical protein
MHAFVITRDDCFFGFFGVFTTSVAYAVPAVAITTARTLARALTFPIYPNSFAAVSSDV